MKDAQKSTRSTAAARKKSSGGFTADERAAMKDYVRERKAAAGKDKADGEAAVRAALAAMPGPDRALGERLHAIIKASAPDLAPRT